MTTLFIDSHAHLTDSLYEDIENILTRAQEAGIEAILNICTDKLTLERGWELSKRYPWIYNVASTTPHDVDNEGETMFAFMAQAAKEKKLSAIGETGLDYHYKHSTPEKQQFFLRRYLHLALECQLPVVIHCREAFADFFRILDEEYQVGGQHAPGVLHCFTGTIAEAEQVLERGWYLSFSGIVTFKKSEELREAAKRTPLNQMLIETDSPYLAPQSKRGKQNEPAFLPETAAVIAAVKGISVEEVAKATADNARRLFKLE
jgi:TatD DNase family protein